MSTNKKNVSVVKETTKKTEEEKSVIFAEKNMYFGDFGHIDRGFNIVKTKFLPDTQLYKICATGERAAFGK